MIVTNKPCSCGRTHKPHNIHIVNEPGALASLPNVANTLSSKPAVVFYDHMTRALFGEAIDKAYEASGQQVHNIVIGSDEKPFEPNLAAVAQVRQALDEADAGLLIGVGAGALNDLAKYVANEHDVKYISVPTAPSMDGYVAPISALLVDGVKVTYDSKAPEGIVADTDILAGPPLPLISAGFADVLGKLTSLRDWELARVLLDEYWCENVSNHVETIASNLLEATDKLLDRDKDAVRLLTEGLLEAGISVFHVGNSRPTSGSEHLVSHYVEMRSFNEGRRPAAHGHVVGFGMIVISELVQSMLKLDADAVKKSVFAPSDMNDVVAQLRLDEVPDNFGKSKFDRTERDARLQNIVERWDDIRAVLEKVPTPETIRAALSKMGAPTTLAEIHIDADMGLDTITNARYMRERYTMLDLAADIGVLQNEAPRIVATYTS